MSKPHLILVVDDDHEDVELFKEALHEINPGITCVSAENGKCALHILKEMEVYPDYIFLDLNMPCLNGKQCLAKIKETNQLLHIPVIIYSTSDAPSDIYDTKKLGASYFLTKPSSFEDIKSAISSILNMKLHPGSTLYKSVLVL